MGGRDGNGKSQVYTEVRKQVMLLQLLLLTGDPVHFTVVGTSARLGAHQHPNADPR